MIDFKENQNPLTSGNGKFLDSLNVGFIQDRSIARCNYENHFIVDPPPHNSDYFSSQLKAVKNYYKKITNEIIDLEISVVDSVYTAVDSNGEELSMESFAYSENDVTSLFKLAIELAENEILEITEENNWQNEDDFIIVVFHAGLGQDLGSPYGVFDPTIYDIHSAYIDSQMIYSLTSQNGIELGSEFLINDGILMPETLNQIFYDVIEDLYSPSFVDDDDLENLYCDYQLGMTGLMSYFLGYRLGFPIMHSTDNISPVTRIGEFGLMDIGAYNGRGVIPSPPDAWSRIYWSSNNQNINSIDDITYDLFMDSNLSSSYDLETYDNNGSILKIDINDGEYFLLENRSNIIKDIELLDDSHKYSIQEIDFILNCDAENNPYCDSTIQSEIKQALFPLNNEEVDFFWFDIIEKLFNCSDCEQFLDENGVIVNFPNYDYGLPGSGLLIWHVQEPIVINGMNNDLMNRAVHLEEADGMSNLGYNDPNPFGSCLDTGCSNDFWFPSNSSYEEVNNSNNIIFDKNSIPNSNTNSGLESNISIKINSINDNEKMNVLISYNSDQIGIIDSSFTRYLGNDGEGIYYLGQNNSIWYSNLFDINEVKSENDFCSFEECVGCVPFDNFDPIDDEILVYNDIVCIAPSSNCKLNILDYSLSCDSEIQKMGFFNESNIEQNVPDICSECDAIGDINLDGLDEIILNGQAYYGHDENLLISGFSNSYNDNHYYLISDLIGDSSPEIISIPKSNGYVIQILSNVGEILEQYPTFGNDLTPSIISNQINNCTFLIHGNRTIKFDKYNIDSHYWHNILGDTYNSGNVGVSNIIRLENYDNWEQAINQENYDFKNVFNYPNPFDENTIFKFYASSIDEISIKIYNISGRLVDEIKIDNLKSNQYNEFSYNTSNLNPGLYLTEFRTNNQSEVIKLIKRK